MLKRLRRLSSDDSGSSTVEFVIVFPAIFILVLAVFESGWLMSRYMMLDRGVDMAVRELRIGAMANPTHETIRNRICDFARILPNCKQMLIVELVPMDLNSAYPRNDANCYPRHEEEPNPTLSVAPGGGSRSELMFVRACMLVDPIIPGLGLGLQLPKNPDTGAHHMITFTAFMNEPA